jgi:hypothetical protein
MGRRSRQRDAAPAAARPSTPPPAPPPPRARRRRASLDEAPKAPWHPVPLAELAVLVGIVALVVGFTSEGSRRETLVTAGVLLASLGGLEVSVREHFAGYRSHTALLTLAAALAAGVPVGLLAGNRFVGLGVAAVAAVLAFAGLRAAFARRAGGMTWRA